MLRHLLIVMALMALGQGTVQALHTPLMLDFMKLSPQQYASVLTLQGIGGVLGTYLVMRYAVRLSPKILLGGGLIISSLTNFLLVTYPAYWVVVLATLIEGVFITGVFVAVPTLIQQQTPSHLMGRAFAAVDAAENGFMLLSMTLSGLLVAYASLPALFVGAALLLATAGLAAVQMMPASETANDPRLKSEA